MAKGDTKTNQYLDIAANGTRADLPTDTCCETRSQTLIREVAERIMDVEDEVEEIKNNPDVVDIVATYADLQAYDTQHLTDKDIIRVLQDETHDGESTYYRYNKQSDTWTYVGESKQYEDFVGTDGTTTGEAGLVPAPVATDAGYFLSASGDWEEIPASGGAKELTSADYDYPADNPNSIAAWALDNGWYTAPGCSVRVNSSTSVGFDSGSLFYVKKGSGSGSASRIVVFGYDNTVKVYSTDTGSGSEYSSTTQTVALAGSTGTSTSLVMTQNATTRMVFADPDNRSKVQIGGTAAGLRSVAIGNSAQTATSNSYDAVAIGRNARSSHGGSVALGAFSDTSAVGEVNIGTSSTSYGYTGNSNYRLLTGLYDGQSAHDAATYGQVISYSAINGAGAPTTATEGKYVGQLYYDTTNEAMYFLKAIDTTTTPATYTWEALGGGSSVNVVQTTGTSTTDVMSQNATTSMVYADPNTKRKIQLGYNAQTNLSNSIALGSGANTVLGDTVAIGSGASAYNNDGIAIGRGSEAGSADYSSATQSIAIGGQTKARAQGAIALGQGAIASNAGEMNIGAGDVQFGYNNSNYRLLSGVYDPQNAHDAATKGYVDGLISALEARIAALEGN